MNVCMHDCCLLIILALAVTYHVIVVEVCTVQCGEVQWCWNEFESGAHVSCAFSLEKFFGRAPQFFGSTNIISHFGEHVHDGQYSLLFFYSQCPPVTSHL